MVVKNDLWAVVIFLFVVVIMALVLGILLDDHLSEANGLDVDEVSTVMSVPNIYPDVPSGIADTQAAEISNLKDRITELERIFESVFEDIAAIRDSDALTNEWLNEMVKRLDSIEEFISKQELVQERIIDLENSFVSLENSILQIMEDNLYMREHINQLENILIWGGGSIAMIILIFLILLITAQRKIQLLQTEVVAQRSRLAKIAHSQNVQKNQTIQSRLEQENLGQKKLEWMVAKEVEKISG